MQAQAIGDIPDQFGFTTMIKLQGRKMKLNNLRRLNSYLFTILLSICCMVSFTSTAAITYVHTDYLGSVVAKSNASGQVTERFHYTPFGKPESTAGLNNEASYTGHIYDDDLSLVYMQARYYDPVIGRFYSNDPVGYKPQNPVMSFNRYLYVNNNPYKYTDPNGEFLFLIPLIGAVVGGYTAYQAAGDMGATENAQLLAGFGGVLTRLFTGGTTALTTLTVKTVVKTAVSSSAATAGKLTAGAMTGAISSGNRRCFKRRKSGK